MRNLRYWLLRASGLALPILTLAAAACNSILDSTPNYADNAIIEVTGTSPVPLLLVSSTDWVYQVDPDNGSVTVSTTSADTISLSLPINRTVALTNSYRIFFQVINPDLDQTASIRMRVRLDEKLMFDQSANMRDASLDYSFAYGTPLGQ